MDASYFAVQRRALEIVGFDPSTPQLSLKHPIWAGILILSLISHNWPMVVYALQDLSDLTRLTDNFAVFMQGSQSTFKFLVMMAKRRRIGSLIHRLHKLNQAASATPNHLERIERENQLDRYVARSFRNAAYGVICASSRIKCGPNGSRHFPPRGQTNWEKKGFLGPAQKLISFWCIYREFLR